MCKIFDTWIGTKPLGIRHDKWQVRGERGNRATGIDLRAKIVTIKLSIGLVKNLGAE